MRKPGTGKAQRGMALIEVLVAVLIFSIGVLAAIGLQATAIHNVTLSKERLDAALVANQQLGKMWTDPANLVAVTNQAVPSLPNGRLNVTVTPTTDASVSQVDIVVTWQSPGATTVSTHAQSVQISNG